MRLPPQHWLHTRRTGVTVVMLLATLTTGASGLILHAGTSGLQSDRMATHPYRPIEAGPPQPEQLTPGTAAASTAPAPLETTEEEPASDQGGTAMDSSLPRTQTAREAPAAHAGPRTQNSENVGVPASEPSPPRTDPTFGAANEDQAHTYSPPPTSAPATPTTPDNRESVGPNMRDFPSGNEYELVTPRPTSAPAPSSPPVQGEANPAKTT